MRIAFALLLAAGCATSRQWTKTDTLLEVGFLAVEAIDWSQTVQMAEFSEAHRSITDVNPILGPHSTPWGVTGYFATTTALHAGVAYLLPKPMRAVWQMAWIGLEAGTVAHNIQWHVGMALP